MHGSMRSYINPVGDTIIVFRNDFRRKEGDTYIRPKISP